MESKKHIVILLQGLLFIQVRCGQPFNRNPEEFFANNQNKMRSIVSLYNNLDSIRHFELFFLQGDTSGIQVFWTAEKTYKYYEAYSKNLDLINYLDSSHIAQKDFLMMVDLMREIKCKYVSKSYLEGENVYYLILGFDNGSLLKDLQYIFLSGQQAVSFFENSSNVRKVAEIVYFRNAKAPGD
jgi:hypothetical protein